MPEKNMKYEDMLKIEKEGGVKLLPSTQPSGKVAVQVGKKIKEFDTPEEAESYVREYEYIADSLSKQRVEVDDTLNSIALEDEDPLMTVGSPEQVLEEYTRGLITGDASAIEEALRKSFTSIEGMPLKKDLTPEAMLADRLRAFKERREGKTPSMTLTRSGQFEGDKRSPYDIMRGEKKMALDEAKAIEALKASSQLRGIRAQQEDRDYSKYQVAMKESQRKIALELETYNKTKDREALQKAKDEVNTVLSALQQIIDDNLDKNSVKQAKLEKQKVINKFLKKINKEEDKLEKKDKIAAAAAKKKEEKQKELTPAQKMWQYR